MTRKDLFRIGRVIRDTPTISPADKRLLAETVIREFDDEQVVVTNTELFYSLATAPAREA